MLLTQSKTISVQELTLPDDQITSLPETTTLPMMTLEQAELALIRQALQLCQGNKQKTAEKLGITKSSLYRRLEKHGLEL